MNAGRPLLAVFSAPKPFTDPHIRTIQRNAIRSWLALGPRVEVLLVGEEDGLAEAAEELGARHLPGVARNAQGTPLVSSIFELARQASTAPLLAYVNADILLLPDILAAAETAQAGAERFLLVSQRWDLDVREALDYAGDWPERLRQRVQHSGRLHPPAGSDLFLFPRACFRHMPGFAIGRAGWDNWMIYHARVQRWTVIDATPSLTLIHQDHDYRHLPGGQPHYRLPESDGNVRLSGGRRTIFHLEDATHTLEQGRLARIPRRGAKLRREAEIFPLVGLRSYPLGMLSYALFHPAKAFGEVRGWLAYKLGQLRRTR